mmetsp:Transcript_54110/g.150492  ORF Transcript_54110/g.150492 Transcript_54110/m.150492 type:complete len:276 (-) Transcript_54110:440-1267(-)
MIPKLPAAALSHGSRAARRGARTRRRGSGTWSLAANSWKRSVCSCAISCRNRGSAIKRARSSSRRCARRWSTRSNWANCSAPAPGPSKRTTRHCSDVAPRAVARRRSAPRASAADAPRRWRDSEQSWQTRSVSMGISGPNCAPVDGSASRRKETSPRPMRSARRRSRLSRRRAADGHSRARPCGKSSPRRPGCAEKWSHNCVANSPKCRPSRRRCAERRQEDPPPHRRSHRPPPLGRRSLARHGSGSSTRTRSSWSVFVPRCSGSAKRKRPRPAV